jgi:MFS transporter, NNP family, nitrate/nitrite transporter
MDLKRHDLIWSAKQASATQSFRAATSNRNTWVLSCQYACSFGVEVAMSQAAVLYLKDAFGQSTQSAMAIASMLGWMNWFARAMGGFYSDYSYNEYGVGGGSGMLQGRLWVVTVLLVAEGIFIFIFSHSRTLAASSWPCFGSVSLSKRPKVPYLELFPMSVLVLQTVPEVSVVLSEQVALPVPFCLP